MKIKNNSNSERIIYLKEIKLPIIFAVLSEAKYAFD